MTNQIQDTIYYEADSYRLSTEPLDTFRPRPNFMAISTANHKGYTAVWSVVANNLFLVALSGSAMDTHATVLISIQK